jgi:hypothetical protein
MRLPQARSKASTTRGRLARVARVATLVMCAGVCGSLLCASAAFAETPLVGSEQTARIGVHGASVSAVLDTPLGSVSYYVEYGTSESYGSQTATATVPGGPETTETTAVTVSLEGLEPGTEYHWRLVATQHRVSEDGADLTLTTYPVGTGGLPDGRVYEMVTSPENPYDSDVYETDLGQINTGLPFQASPDGEAVVYAGFPSAGGTGATGNGHSNGEQYRATREPGGGWSTQNITLESPNSGRFWAFLPDLSEGFISIETALPLSSAASMGEGEVLAHYEAKLNGGYSDLYSESLDDGVFRPLFTRRPPNREPEEFEEYVKGVLLASGTSLGYAGASADGSDLLFAGNDDLLEGDGKLEGELEAIVKQEAQEIAKEKTEHLPEVEAEPTDNRQELYESVNGSLRLVNVLPDGSPAPGAVFGGAGNDYKEEYAKALALPRSDLDHVISADGSRVFWTDMETSNAQPGVIYVRENGDRTVQVSSGPAQYWDASPDGDFVLYSESGALWLFDVNSESREEIAGGEGGVQGVLGMNETGEDASYIYFVAHEALDSAANAAGQLPVAGRENLYASEPDPVQPGQRTIHFIATLQPQGAEPEDAEWGDSQDWTPGLGLRTAQVTADGSSVVFSSTENFTGHPYPSEGAEEVYVYRAGEARLYCVSCRPQASGGRLPTSLEAEEKFEKNGWNEANPLWDMRLISADGERVFFESEAPLVARDLNGANDVYEWEPEGVGQCAEAEGCDYLLSGGLEYSAFFAGASENGNDVFIATRQRLAPEDKNEIVDLYDARVGGSEAVLAPECSGTSCQGPPAPAPVFATPPSGTFEGIGNFSAAVGARHSSGKSGGRKKSLNRAQQRTKALRACRKQHRGGARKSCEARVRKRYAQASRATGSTSARGR